MSRCPALPLKMLRIGRHCAVMVALCTVATSPALGADGNRLKVIEKALEQDRAKAEQLQTRAAALEKEIITLRAESISTARKAQNFETQLSEIEAQLAALEEQETAKVADLETRRAQMGGTLAALQRIALQPVEAMIVSPAAPVDTVRSAMLLRVAIPAIEIRAAALRKELESLATLRREIAVQRNDLATTGQALLGERERLSALIQRKSNARTEMTVEQQAALDRAANMAAEAKDLRDLLERVEREAQEQAERIARDEAERLAREDAARQLAQEEAARQAQTPTTEATPAIPPPPQSAPTRQQTALARPDNIRPFPESGTSLVMPARGSIIVRYGQNRGGNGAAKGITIAARGNAQVVAPFDGKVVYAGNFRRYGQILIIEHGGRYHTLLAGLDRIDAVVGQWLLAGEPVGILGAPGSGAPELYLELRRAGQPINPLPWLATIDDKVQG
ncbi:MAG: peptidoglycan DD-metalloendopeptidase family protein [Alphaproteobacteria bacterium]